MLTSCHFCVFRCIAASVTNNNQIQYSWDVCIEVCFKKELFGIFLHDNVIYFVTCFAYSDLFCNLIEYAAYKQLLQLILQYCKSLFCMLYNSVALA